MIWRRAGVRGAVGVLVVLVALAGVFAVTGRPDDRSHPVADQGEPSSSGTPARTRRPTVAPGRAASTAPAPSDRPDAPARRPVRWRVPPGTPWQWQLSGTVDRSVDVPVYDIDGFENSAATVAALHARGRRVICYLNVGAAENFRPDYHRFPAAVLGAADGWEGERWLDIRRTDVLLPIMAARIAMCARKGFDAVEPDLVDGYESDTGFPLTAHDQLRYNRAIADLVHRYGLAVGLKNDLEQIPRLVGAFDFAVNEQCAEFDECDALSPFIRQGKAVFHVEYALPLRDFCPTARRLRLSSMRKDLALDASRQPC